MLYLFIALVNLFAIGMCVNLAIEGRATELNYALLVGNIIGVIVMVFFWWIERR